jgi:hypothetical protein
MEVGYIVSRWPLGWGGERDRDGERVLTDRKGTHGVKDLSVVQSGSVASGLLLRICSSRRIPGYDKRMSTHGQCMRITKEQNDLLTQSGRKTAHIDQLELDILVLRVHSWAAVGIRHIQMVWEL